MSEIARLKFGKVDKEFYVTKEAAVQFIVAYEDVTMEVGELDELED